jgi:NADH:quinone reductase (non-electrogenic)
MKNRITELLGIRYPIVQGGMMWVGRAELASAVSNAGGLGIITALTQPSPDALREEIRRCRNMTDKPFGVNLTILPSINPPPYMEYITAAVEEGIKIIETAGQNPEPFLPYLKKNNVKVIHKCTSVRHALKAERVGVDAVSVDGFECAGHPGEDDVPNLILLAVANEKLTIPMLASGGIGNGYQMAAVMALGAEGVNMGTRFVATVEAPVHENMKQAMIAADERCTTLMFRSLGNTARVYKNSVSLKVVEIESYPGNTDFADLKELVAGVRGRERCIEAGEINDGIWTAGMVMGLIHDIPTCAELIERMMEESRSAVRNRLASLLLDT